MNTRNKKQDHLQVLPAAVAVDICKINSYLFRILEESQKEYPDMEYIKRLTIGSLDVLPYPNQIELHKYK